MAEDVEQPGRDCQVCVSGDCLSSLIVRGHSVCWLPSTSLVVASPPDKLSAQDTGGGVVKWVKCSKLKILTMNVV